MKLRNKKTGDIIESYIIETASAIGSGLILQDDDTNKHYQYNSFAEFCAEWEDYEEPKEIWWLDNEGHINHASGEVNDSFRNNREIGNYFLSREEAEKAVDKLKAWKRLKDKGFRFESAKRYEALCGNGFNIPITATMPPEAYTDVAVSKDLDICFGGE